MQIKNREYSTIKKRILQYLEHKGISNYEFYQKTGIANGVLSQKGGISEDNILKFISYYRDINPTWLLTGEGDMLKSEPARERVERVVQPVERFRHKSDVLVDSVRVPLFNIETIAGVVAVFDHLTDNEPIAYLEIPNLPKCDGAVYMVGDSMYPLLKSGDIIIYKQLNNIQNILWGEMYLLSIVHDGDTYITVKYVKQSATPGYVTLVSYNEHHQPKDFPIDSIRFAAIVKASVRINSMG